MCVSTPAPAVHGGWTAKPGSASGWRCSSAADSTASSIVLSSSLATAGCRDERWHRWWQRKKGAVAAQGQRVAVDLVPVGRRVGEMTLQ
eukprot:COSAG01_NODE_54280_length_333_cov_0.666667_1_plen_88_part_10